MSKRVLIAEPDESLLEAYQQFLSHAGFQVATATSGTECLAKLQKWNPDVLILEPETANGWGDALLELITNHPELSVPVLILSRRDRKVVKYPVREYHVKPFSIAELAKSIRRVTSAQPESCNS